MNSFIKNISYAVISNAVSFIGSAVITLVVPKFLSVEAYGYFQLYLFYLSYIGFCCFGWIDGIVLRYAGHYYEKLNFSNFKTQFVIYCVTQLAIAGVFVSATTFFIYDAAERQVYTLLGLAIVFSSPCSFFRYLLQAVGKVKEYSRNLLIERTIYTILVLLFLIIGFTGFFWLILADLVGKIVSLVCVIIDCKEITLAPFGPWRKAIREGWANVSCGIKLLAANGASLFIVGIVRYAVQIHWDVIAFAKVSFALSISNLFMVFIRAVSIVLLPQLKRVMPDKLPEIYGAIRALLMILLFAMLIAYYPISSILSTWLPQYKESLRYMGLLFPICIFESKNSLLIETYLKTYRKEKTLLIINCSTVGLSFVLTWLTVFVFSNLNLAMLSVVFLLWFRCGVSELIIEKLINRRLITDITKETLLVIIFIVCSWLVTGWIGTAVYLVTYVFYVVQERKKISNVMNLFKESM